MDVRGNTQSPPASKPKEALPSQPKFQRKEEREVKQGPKLTDRAAAAPGSLPGPVSRPNRSRPGGSPSGNSGYAGPSLREAATPP